MFQLWEKEWNEMINSFGLVMHGNISISICITVSYKQEYQPTDEKYSICMTKSTSFIEKTPNSFRSACSTTQAPPLLI